MLVAEILKRKGSNVITANPADSVSAIARLLASHRIGAVLLTSADGTIAGILSERDIVRAIATEGAAALERPASALMTRAVHTCLPTSQIAEVMRIMTERRIRHLPVLAEGRLAGLVSIGDVVKERVGETEQQVEMLQDYISGG